MTRSRFNGGVLPLLVLMLASWNLSIFGAQAAGFHRLHIQAIERGVDLGGDLFGRERQAVHSGRGTGMDARDGARSVSAERSKRLQVSLDAV